jgi:polysaccharide deacetylase family protein (PEP-CTERM system associated)
MVGEKEMTNAFCIDLEEWFHVCGVETPYLDPATWDAAPAHVVEDTETILGLLAEAGARGTFLTVGWIAEKYPDLIRKISAAGHEIGCHSYFHRLLYEMSPDELRVDLDRCLRVLRDVSRQPVTVFRAPGFSMKKECYWSYPILREFGLEIDVSVVPAQRDHGGIDGFPRGPFLLQTEAGQLSVFPVSVLDIAGKTIPFSGGGYLRLFPLALVRYGFRQNRAAGRPCMTYIHPREVNVDQPRLQLPMVKSFKYYIGMKTVQPKLRSLLRTYSFTTVSETLASCESLARYNLVDGEIRGETKVAPSRPA